MSFDASGQVEQLIECHTSLLSSICSSAQGGSGSKWHLICGFWKNCSNFEAARLSPQLQHSAKRNHSLRSPISGGRQRQRPEPRPFIARHSHLNIKETCNKCHSSHAALSSRLPNISALAQPISQRYFGSKFVKFPPSTSNGAPSQEKKQKVIRSERQLATKSPVAVYSRRDLKSAAIVKPFPLLLMLMLMLSVCWQASSFQVEARSLESQAQVRNLKARVSRQLAGGGSGQQQASSNNRRQADTPNVPYKTVLVTSACEWKSNLFVPKSNDIHFATSPLEQPASVNPSANFNSNGFDLPAGSGSLRNRQQQAEQFQELDEGPNSSRVFFSTENRALVLAMPLEFGPNFAGFEQACSIRLIVPKNMRILAKLSARRLSFAAAEQSSFASNWPQQQPPLQSALFQPQPQSFQLHQQVQQQHADLWLNVSQAALVETEHKTLESLGNVLAFRFLLERFAHKRQPDLRFQVVLTAFQTLSENGDLNVQPNRANFAPPNASSASSSLEQQFICDQQRLISANLACDGYKNCQDGHDEDVAVCQSLRDSSTNLNANQPTQTLNHQLDSNGSQIKPIEQDSGFSLASLDSNTISWLAGLLLGIFVIALLLLCFVYFLYACLIVWQRRFLEPAGYQQQDTSSSTFNSTQRDTSGATASSSQTSGMRFGSSGGSSARLSSKSSRIEPKRPNRRERLALALAKAGGKPSNQRLSQQNSENERRLLAASQQTGGLQPAKLQSILKRPTQVVTQLADRMSMGASQQQLRQQQQRPSEAPPAIPSRSGKRVGALASQLNEQHQQQHQQQLGAQDQIKYKPTPAQRLTRPTRPVPEPRATGGRGPRITTYHYSGGSTQFTSAYLERLAEEQLQNKDKQPEDRDGDRGGEFNSSLI